MFDLAGLIAPVVRGHDHKLRDLEYALELHSYALDASGAFAAMNLRRARRQEQRKADKYLEGRGYDWSARLTTAPGAARHETRSALDRIIAEMMAVRDRLPPGTSAFFRAQDEVCRLTAMAASA